MQLTLSIFLACCTRVTGMCNRWIRRTNIMLYPAPAHAHVGIARQRFVLATKRIAASWCDSPAYWCDVGFALFPARLRPSPVAENSRPSHSLPFSFPPHTPPTRLKPDGGKNKSSRRAVAIHSVQSSPRDESCCCCCTPGCSNLRRRIPLFWSICRLFWDERGGHVAPARRHRETETNRAFEPERGRGHYGEAEEGPGDAPYRRYRTLRDATCSEDEPAAEHGRQGCGFSARRKTLAWSSWRRRPKVVHVLHCCVGLRWYCIKTRLVG